MNICNVHEFMQLFCSINHVVLESSYFHIMCLISPLALPQIEADEYARIHREMSHSDSEFGHVAPESLLISYGVADWTDTRA